MIRHSNGKKYLLSIFLVVGLLIGMSSVTVVAEGETIGSVLATYEEGSDILITYTGTSAKDWVGIYLEGTTPGTDFPSIQWYYTSDTAQPDGTMLIYGTLAVGKYEAILCKDDGYTVAARVPFEVVNNGISMTPAAESFEKGGEISIAYTGTSAKDWIGIYPEGTLPGTDNPSLLWQYTSDTAQPDGTMVFEATLDAGTYSVFLLKDDGYDILAISSIEITAPAATATPEPTEAPASSAAESTPDDDGGNSTLAIVLIALGVVLVAVLVFVIVKRKSKK